MDLPRHFDAVLWIPDILVWIRILIFSSVPFKMSTKMSSSLPPTPNWDRFDVFAAFFICNIFLTTQHVPSSSRKGGDGFYIHYILQIKLS